MINIYLQYRLLTEGIHNGGQYLPSGLRHVVDHPSAKTLTLRKLAHFRGVVRHFLEGNRTISGLSETVSIYDLSEAQIVHRARLNLRNAVISFVLGAVFVAAGAWLIHAATVDLEQPIAWYQSLIAVTGLLLLIASLPPFITALMYLQDRRCKREIWEHRPQKRDCD